MMAQKTVEENDNYRKLTCRKGCIIEQLSAERCHANLAQRLVSRKLITDHMCLLGNNFAPGVVETTRISPLLDAVIGRVKLNPERFETFVCVIRDDLRLDDLAEFLEKPLQPHEIPEAPAPQRQKPKPLPSHEGIGSREEIDSPTIVNPVIRITGAPQGPTTNTTVDLTAECIEGYHPVTFEWVDVANESVILGREAKFTVKVSGKVTYCCTAKNAFGKGTASTVVEGRKFDFNRWKSENPHLFCGIIISLITLLVLTCTGIGGIVTPLVVHFTHTNNKP